MCSTLAPGHQGCCSTSAFEYHPTRSDLTPRQEYILPRSPGESSPLFVHLRLGHAPICGARRTSLHCTIVPLLLNASSGSCWTKAFDFSSALRNFFRPFCPFYERLPLTRLPLESPSVSGADKRAVRDQSPAPVRKAGS
jgi:hypothetical protein